MKIRIALAAIVAAASFTAIPAAHATVTRTDAPNQAPVTTIEFIWE